MHRNSGTFCPPTPLSTHILHAHYSNHAHHTSHLSSAAHTASGHAPDRSTRCNADARLSGRGNTLHIATATLTFGSLTAAVHRFGRRHPGVRGLRRAGPAAVPSGRLLGAPCSNPSQRTPASSKRQARQAAARLRSQAHDLCCSSQLQATKFWPPAAQLAPPQCPRPLCTVLASIAST